MQVLCYCCSCGPLSPLQFCNFFVEASAAVALLCALARFYSFIYLRIFHVFSSSSSPFFFVIFLVVFGKFCHHLAILLPPSARSLPAARCPHFLCFAPFCIFARTKLPLYCFDLSYFVCCQRWAVSGGSGWALGGSVRNAKPALKSPGSRFGFHCSRCRCFAWFYFTALCGLRECQSGAGTGAGAGAVLFVL